MRHESWTSISVTGPRDRLRRGGSRQGLVHLACWAHTRRGFVDVLKSLGLNPKKLPANSPVKARRALYALQQIRTLYAIERRIRDKPPDYRRLARQTESVPVLNKLRAWLDDTIDKVPPGCRSRTNIKYYI